MQPDSYETEELLHQYLLFHYGSAEDRMPWDTGPRMADPFPVACVEAGLDKARLQPGMRGLDVGCAVGRSTFELARYLDDVIGIDYSDTFVMAAHLLCRERRLPYTIKETGTITRSAEAMVPDVECSRVHFEQGDAERLRETLGTFDVVLAANLLCRLSDPRLFLTRLKALVNPGGQVIITTPNTWLETFTGRSYWLGATPETGEPLEALEAEMSEAFEKDMVTDVPFCIREHRRKYQWSVAQMSRWIRKG